MNGYELVRSYLNTFYSGGDPENLGQLFTDTMVFDGPYLSTTTAIDYIAALKQGESTPMQYSIVKQYQDDESICVVYEVAKESREFLVNQVFWFSKGKISKILTVFDSNQAGK